MKGKGGLSQVVTTLILILLILAAIGGVWISVSSFIDSSADKINLNQLSLGFTLKKAVIDYDTGLADVRVRRDSADGNVKSIKFIVEDDKSSEIYEEFFSSFPELAERTFTLNLSQSEFLTLNKIHKISIAPVFELSSGTLETGGISGSAEGLNKDLGGDDNSIPSEQAECSVDIDCPIDSFLELSDGCNSAKTMITKTKIDNFCIAGSCRSAPIYDFVTEDCSSQGKICYNGKCINEEVKCVIDSECGEDGPIGELKCHSTLNATARDFKDFTCSAEKVCEISITEEVVEMCLEGDICHNGKCFTPLECTINDDCCKDPSVPYCGRICNEGNCENEVAKNLGIISSAWPPGIGEYFDSADLNTVDLNKNIIGQTIIFPGSAESRCLSINDFVHVDANGVISYVRLSEANTEISSGDNYEVWETPFGCTKI